MSRCTGHCCERFSLPVSPMELAHQNRRRLAGKSTKWLKSEIEKLSDMLIFLRPDYHGTPHPLIRGLKRVVPKRWQWKSKESSRSYIYTCKYHDRATGNCLNYANRPALCSNYNQEGGCGYRGCTMVCPKKEAVPLIANLEKKQEAV